MGRWDVLDSLVTNDSKNLETSVFQEIPESPVLSDLGFLFDLLRCWKQEILLKFFDFESSIDEKINRFVSFNKIEIKD